MSSIPGAHASLGFGRKRVDFYASPGVTAGAGQRRGEHEIRDADGASHSMRLSRPDTPLETGETVTVLRAQSGPDHGSRPVAVINHDRNAWTRTAPEATAVLARSGITRSANWWMTMLLFMVTAIAFAWSDIRLFMLEVDPGIFASLPAFDVFALVSNQIPALLGLDLAAAIPGFDGLIGSLGLPGWLSAQTLAFAMPLTVIALITYFARSWRIIWAPVYVFAAIATGLALGAPSPLTPAILALAGIGLLFCVGGFINRTRDAGRLEGRIARLSENILRHPPAEAVAAPVAAGAALAGASAMEAGVEEAESPAVDDLPSDEELATARGETDDADPAPVPSMPATAQDANADEASTSDRDMVMPPPPPLANRTVSSTAESGEAGTAEEDAETDPGETGEPDAPATAAASAMQAPTPAPVEASEDEQPSAEAPPPAESDLPDTPATATASAMQAPTPEATSDAEDAAPVIEPAPETPAAEDVHAFASPDSGPAAASLMSSRDIADAEDAPDAPDAAPIAPQTRNNASSDEEPDPFMSSESETPRQTDS